MARSLLAATAITSLWLASSAHADTELYQLRQGESPAIVAARTYGDKSYLAVLKVHTRLRPRAHSIRLPSLRQVLFEEKVQALEPNAMEKVLQAQEEFFRGSRASSPACDGNKEWQAKERQLFEQAAQDLTNALGLLKEVEPVPHAMIAHLSRASAGLQDLGGTRGKARCKTIHSIHRGFAYAMASSIEWARRQHRRS